MPTTIVPALGAAQLFTEGGQGASPGYSALDRRRSYGADLQAGVVGGNDFKVVQRGAGANMSVDVTMPAGGAALVRGTAVTGQGLYQVQTHNATVNEVVAAAHATLPRIDSVYLRIYDTLHDASGLNRAEIVVVTGTATSGATLDNRTGAGAQPGSSLRLADILVPAASTSVTQANIRDRRTWARGGRGRATHTGGMQIIGTADTLMNPTMRLECSGAPLTMTLTGIVLNPGVASTLGFAPVQDGVLLLGANAFTNSVWRLGLGAGYGGPVQLSYAYTPPAGSHVLRWAGRTDVNSQDVQGSAAMPLIMTAYETVAPYVTND